MLEQISSILPTVIATLAVLGAVLAAAASFIRDKKKNKSILGCGGGCSGCPGGKTCGKQIV